MKKLANSRGRFAAQVMFVLATASCMSSPASAEILNFTMRLDGGQEVPAVTTPATGSGAATLDTTTNLFSWNITFSGLSAAQTAAHFHGPALQCVAAGVLIGLPNGSPIVGSANVSAAQAMQIQNGQWYVNVHTTTNPGGEIRGQVMPSPLDDPVPGPLAVSPYSVQLQPITTGLVAPNWGGVAPGYPDDIFVTDQPGQLYRVNIDTGAATLFLDVGSIIVPMGAFGPGSFDERGLLGVAFHPDYLTNGKFYLFLSKPATPNPDFTTLTVGQIPNCQTAISEFTVVDPANPASLPLLASERILLRIDKPQFNHNGGALNFGPDGMLYISTGDGGAGDDQGAGHACNGNGQTLSNPLGKILRIDPLGSNSTNGQYGIPADNPFVATPGAVDEIYAYGLRNPFRFSFDSQSGYMYVGDVGQNDIEEVDIVFAGDNMGWNHKEGTFYFVRNGSIAGYVTNQPLLGPTGLIEPIAQYDHDEGISVIGGFVYRGTRMEPLIGRYIFGEFAQTFATNGRLLHLDGSDVINEFQLVPNDIDFFLLGLGQDSKGELYVMVNSTGVPSGTTGVILRIRRALGDTNMNGVVNVDDLLDVINGWGACPKPPAACVGDLTGNGEVDVDDLLEVINNWTPR